MSSDEVGKFVVPIGSGQEGKFDHIDDLPPVDAESRPYSPWIGRLEMGATAFLGGAYLRGMHEMNDVKDQREAVASAMTDVQAAIDEGNTVVDIRLRVLSSAATRSLWSAL